MTIKTKPDVWLDFPNKDGYYWFKEDNIDILIIIEVFFTEDGTCFSYSEYDGQAEPIPYRGKFLYIPKPLLPSR